MAKQKAPVRSSNHVRALVTHIEPDTQIYRNEGDVFERVGEPYKHIEPASGDVDDAEENE